MAHGEPGDINYFIVGPDGKMYHLTPEQIVDFEVTPEVYEEVKKSVTLNAVSTAALVFTGDDAHPFGASLILPMVAEADVNDPPQKLAYINLDFNMADGFETVMKHLNDPEEK